MHQWTYNLGNIMYHCTCIMQRNLQIAQIPRLHGSYTCTCTVCNCSLTSFRCRAKTKQSTVLKEWEKDGGEGVSRGCRVISSAMASFISSVSTSSLPELLSSGRGGVAATGLPSSSLSLCCGSLCQCVHTRVRRRQQRLLNWAANVAKIFMNSFRGCIALGIYE